MPVSCRTVIGWLEEWALPRLVEDWDNVGLQVGSPGTEINKVLVTLELTPEVMAEAVQEKVQLIVSHHPLIRDPLPNLNYENYPTSLVIQLVEKHIHLYTAHTNMDAAAGGVNDVLAASLSLAGVRVMRLAPQEMLYKLVVFVPRGQEDQVRRSICNAGAGWIGNYDECTFQTGGTGTFRPLPGANPWLGRIGELEQAEELRLETVVTESKLAAVIKAMLGAHPYEEVAYDLYQLKNQVPDKSGLGRVGCLPEAVPLRVFAQQVRDALGLQTVRLAGDPERMVSRVALCGGSAMSLLKWALRAGADVYVTGDVKHHDALNALGQGIAVVDAGHHATEKGIVPVMAAYLTNKAKAAGEQLEVMVSRVNTDPLSLLLPTPSTHSRGATPADRTPSPIKSTVNRADDPVSRASQEVQSAENVTRRLLIYIDGASRGNPGDAGAGVAILNEQREPLIEKKQYLGQTTNNSAEYQALILALEETLNMRASQVEIYTDSELLARQWNGQYRVQNPGLVTLMQQARRLASQLQSCRISHVPREQNKRADKLANLAIDEHNKHAKHD